jgi:hypothetical protein
MINDKWFQNSLAIGDTTRIYNYNTVNHAVLSLLIIVGLYSLNHNTSMEYSGT